LPRTPAGNLCASKSPKMVKTYLEAVEGLDRFLAEKGMPRSVEAIRREHIEAHVLDLMERWTGGCRATELVNLTTDDVNLDDSTVRLVGKGEARGTRSGWCIGGEDHSCPEPIPPHSAPAPVPGHAEALDRGARPHHRLRAAAEFNDFAGVRSLPTTPRHERLRPDGWSEREI
jgi:hypothetical protein